MSESLEKLDLKISTRECELVELRKARDLLAEALQLTPQKPNGTRRLCLTMEIQGHELRVTTRQAVVLQLLTSLDDDACVPSNAIREVVGDGAKAAEMHMSRLRKKLEAAGVPAEIVHFRGEGYRLQMAQVAA